jgi:hypothetical protein
MKMVKLSDQNTKATDVFAKQSKSVSIANMPDFAAIVKTKP